MALNPLVVVSLAATLGLLPVSPARGDPQLADAEKATPHAITMLAVSNGAASGDRICWQESPTWIEQVAADEEQVGATHATLEVPMDGAGSYRTCKPSPADPVTYETTWISALRAHNMHVWFRQQWNSWSGGYEFPKLTYATHSAVPYETRRGTDAVLDGSDRSSYLAKTYHYILAHPQFYKDGDVFTPVGEPQDSGVGLSCRCQFPSFAEMNRFLRDSITLDRRAFNQLGVNVLVGLDGTSCDYTDLEPATVRVMGVVGVDCYVPSAQTLIRDLKFVHQAYGVPIVLSEWGAIYDGGRQPATANSIASVMQALLDAHFVVGFDYWQSYGGTAGENVVDPMTLGVSQSGRELATWYAYSLSLARRSPGEGNPSASLAVRAS